GGDGVDLLPGPLHPPPGRKPAQDPGAHDAGDDPADDAEADLLQDDPERFDVTDAFFGLGDGEEDDQQGHTDAVVQAALDVETLADAGGQPPVANHRQPQRGV